MYEEEVVYPSQPNQLDEDIANACGNFLEQVKLLLPINALSVVLMDTRENTGRVAFSWKAPTVPVAWFGGRTPLATVEAEPTSLNLPINGNYGFLGTLLVRMPISDGFPGLERRMLGDLLNLLAIRLENIQLRRRIQTTNLELHLVDEIAQIVTSTHDIADIYASCAQAIQKVVPFDRICINVIDPETQELIVDYTDRPALPERLPGGLVPLGDVTTGHLWQTAETIIRSDISIEPRFEIDQSLAQLGLKSVISVPLIASGTVVGSLSLHHGNAHIYGSREQAILERLAGQIALAAESSYLEERIRLTAVKTRVLNEVTSIVGAARNLEELFRRVSASLSHAINFDEAQLSWISSNENDYHIDSLRTARPTAPAKLHSDGEFLANPTLRLTTPLTHRSSSIGELELRRRHSAFNAKEQELLHLAGNLVAPAVHNAGLQQISIRQAYQLRQQAKGGPTQQSIDNSAGPNNEPIAQLAHALYSPLTSIKGYTGSLLQADTDWPEEVRREFLKTINQAADRLDHAIRDLVLPRPSELSQGSGSVKSTLIQDIFRRLELEFADSEARLGFECDPELSPITVESVVIERAIKDLIHCASAWAEPRSETRVVAVCNGDSAAVSLEFTQCLRQPWQPRLDTDLRLAISRKLLAPVGISVKAETLDNDLVRLQFEVPVTPKGGND